jgi:hypothetical protein
MELLRIAAPGEYSSVILTTRRASPEALSLIEEHFSTRTLEQLDPSAIFYSFTCDPVIVPLRFILDADHHGFSSLPERLLTASFASAGEEVFVGGIMGLDFEHSPHFYLPRGNYAVRCGGYLLGRRCNDINSPVDSLFVYEHHIFLFQPEPSA